MARTVNYEINVDADDGLRSLGQLESELSQLNEMISQVGDRSSPEFRSLAMEIQGVTRQLESANQQIEGFTAERRRMALQGSIDAFTGGVQAVAGLSQQLGFANEEAEEQIANLLAISATASGVRTAFQGVSELRVALQGSAVAQRALNLAANANPYVLLATAVLALVAAYVLLRESAEDVAEAQERANKAAREAETIRRREAQSRENRDILNNRRLLVESIEDEIALYGDEDSESGLIGAQIRLLRANLDLTADYFQRRDLLRQITVLEREYAEVIDSELRPALETVNEITSSGIEVQNQSIEAKETDIVVSGQRTDAETGSFDSILSATQDFANQTAQIAEESKGVAVAAVIVNAAVAGIAAFRSWTEDGPFGPIGNAIGLGAQLAILGTSTAIAIDSILSANPSSSGAGASPPQGPTVSTPNISAAMPNQNLGQGQTIEQVMAQSMRQMQDQTIMAVVAQGDIQNSNERSARANNQRRLNRR